jgi:iron(III) transport system substrate-binding protein
MFGGTATHFLALRQSWGAERWEGWCRALAANKPFLVDGNSVVAKLVARGEVWIGLTDSDDIAAEQHEGAPLASLPMTEETLLISNTVAVIRDAPHPGAAERLWKYLQQPAIAKRLLSAGALEGVSVDSVTSPTLRADWEGLLTNLTQSTATLKHTFLR